MSVKVEDLLKIILRQSELLREEVIQALFQRLRDGNLINKNDTLTIEHVSAIQDNKTQLLQWLHRGDANEMTDTIMLCRQIIDTLNQKCAKHNTWNLYRDYKQQILHHWQNHGMTTNPFLVSLHGYSWHFIHHGQPIWCQYNTRTRIFIRSSLTHIRDRGSVAPVYPPAGACAPPVNFRHLRPRRRRGLMSTIYGFTDSGSGEGASASGEGASASGAVCILSLQNRRNESELDDW